MLCVYAVETSVRSVAVVGYGKSAFGEILLPSWIFTTSSTCWRSQLYCHLLIFCR